MFRKVLFPTDFSPGAYKAIRIFEKKNKVKIKELILRRMFNNDKQD